jgi:acyl dehydratase
VQGAELLDERHSADRNVRPVTLPSYSVVARNIEPTSDNRIHADDVAQQFGFTGALVPGVDLFAYVTAPLVSAWGPQWLAGGRVDVRFRRPVYDGERVEVTGTPDGLTLVGPDGVVRAVGSADPPSPQQPRRSLPATPPPTEHMPTDALGLGPLGTVEVTVSTADNEAYLDAIGDPHSSYRAEAVTHPAGLLRLVNLVLMSNVELGPWIHTASDCRLLAPARLPATLSARAEVTELFERNGSSYVRYDAVVLADGTPVMDVAHTAIYRLGG